MLDRCFGFTFPLQERTQVEPRVGEVRFEPDGRFKLADGWLDFGACRQAETGLKEAICSVGDRREGFGSRQQRQE